MVFKTDGCDDIRIESATALQEREYYKFINSWQSLPGTRLEEVDITEYVDEYEICAWADVHGHTARAQLPDSCEPVRANSHTGYFFDPETFKQYQSEIESIFDEVSIHAGPNHHRRLYRFDGDDFIQYLCWFITEGCTHWSDSSDTVQVKIAQENRTHLRTIEDLVERMGLGGHSDYQKVEFASKDSSSSFVARIASKSASRSSSGRSLRVNKRVFSKS